ncbi:serine hydrolase [Sporomusa termitida]|uniref:Extended-spectrum beta-lactamase PER-1 n=1 Tax=Sporomusa termitida TaxID=2377 RepID=A0A517DYG6_9FIRM|nr:serine hydrolase [Sporomusa termitida]QDR82397.1 Extended-spectrum beta-lactamase PER-1 [Sporomusa termitida]
MERLHTKIQTLLAQYSCRSAVIVRNESTGNALAINPAMVFPAASMIKIPIMIEVMRQAAAGKLPLAKTVAITSQMQTGGAGILKELQPGIKMTVAELVTLMIILSDNTATNVLIDLAGMAAINAAITGLGLRSTVLQRKMMDFAAAKAGRENLTSAADLARLFAGIAGSTPAVPPPYNAMMLDILKRQQIRDKLPFYLPAEVIIAHKTGTLAGAEHDGGILFAPGGPYIICVLTAELTANYEGLQLVAMIGKIIYEYIA